MIEAFIIDFIILSKHYYCLWYSDEQDFFVIVDNKLFYTNDISELKNKYSNNYNISDNITIFDLAQLNAINNKDTVFNYNLIIDFWNMMSDLSRSLKIEFYGNTRERSIDKVYDKVFYALNLPSITPENKEYTPIWKPKEINIICEVIDDGIAILYNCFDIKS